LYSSISLGCICFGREVEKREIGEREYEKRKIYEKKS
jgi:hypothetical protein